MDRVKVEVSVASPPRFRVAPTSPLGAHPSIRACRAIFLRRKASGPGMLLPLLALILASALLHPVFAVDVFVDSSAGCSTASTCGKNGNPSCCRIQLAICNAVSGDVVKVKPGINGTYNESIRFKPGVSVVSTNGPGATTIDGTGRKCNSSSSTDYCSENSGAATCSTVLINGPVHSDARLDGFTIKGGKGAHVVFNPPAYPNKTMGGAIYISGSAAITNNTITGNNLNGSDQLWYGGGIAVVRPSTPDVPTPQITNNTITGNTAKPPASPGQGNSYGYGGGIYVGYNTKPTIENNTITSNEAGDRTLGPASLTMGSGGGVFVHGNTANGSTVITRKLDRGNQARDLGGGVTVYSYCLGGGCG